MFNRPAVPIDFSEGLAAQVQGGRQQEGFFVTRVVEGGYVETLAPWLLVSQNQIIPEFGAQAEVSFSPTFLAVGWAGRDGFAFVATG